MFWVICDIKCGENVGCELYYVNIVMDWLCVGIWNMWFDKMFKVNVEGDQLIVVLVQYEGYGQIVVVVCLN